MAIRQSEAEWKGTLREGSGRMKVGQTGFEGPYSYASRFEEAGGTNPEELIAAAHSGCFSMAFSAELTKAGFPPTSVHTVAKVYLENAGGGFGITKIELVSEGVVPNIDAAKFAEVGEAAKKGCPISRALSAVPITLEAKLLP